MSDAGLMTVTEIVEKYDVSRKTIQRWVNSDPPRVVPALTLPGKTGAHLFTPDEAERAFGAHKEAKETKAPRKPRAKKVVADEPEQLLLPEAEEAPAPEVEPEHFDDDDDDFEPPAAKK